MDEAERASRVKSEFLAVMSHEPRTPLNAIIGYGDLLEQGVVGNLNEEQSAYLGRIRTCSNQLLGLIDQVQGLSRIEAGTEELLRECFDVSAVTTEAVALVKPVAVKKGLTVEVLTPGVPMPCETDSGKVRQILVNLLSNAVKFTSEGGVEIRVEPEGGMVAVHVSDTGAGISQQDLDRIFEPFVQLDASTTRRHGGTGLGLPLSRDLARLVGGELTVASSQGKGSTFTLRVPCPPPADPSGEADEKPIPLADVE